MSSDYHINVTKEQFAKLIPTPNHLVVKIDEAVKGKLLTPRNESKDPLIVNTGTVWKLPEEDNSFKLYQRVVFEKYVGNKIRITGSDSKYILIHKKYVKLQINEPVFVENEDTCSDESYMENYQNELQEKMRNMPPRNTGDI